MDDIRNSINQIINYINVNDINGLENYFNNNNFNIIIVKEYIKDDYYLISKINESLISYINLYNCNDKIKFILNLLDSPSNELLTKALKSNNLILLIF